MNQDFDTMNIDTPEMDTGSYPSPHRIKQIQIIAFSVLIIAGLLVTMSLQNRAHELKTKEAYVVSTLIVLQEDHLLLKYQLLPQDVGLANLKNAWTNNPCYETATQYSNALENVIDELQKQAEPTFQPINGEPIKV